MKKKIYFFSDKTDTDYLAKLDFLDEYLEIVPYQGLSAEETLKMNFDFIELADGDYESFKAFIPAVSWKTSHIGVADILIKSPKSYQPMNLTADCILKILKRKTTTLNTSQSAMIIGSYDFVLSLAVKVALAGYSNLIISLNDNDRSKILETKIKEFIFNLNLTFVRMNELTQIQTTSGLLISNVSEQMDPEAFESLTYFNFLSSGAVFVDFQSFKNSDLVEEAMRAELNVIEELEILTLKYKTLIEFCKNSSLV
jgi:hypothetical protein